jgi:hypothetical protein
MNSLILAHNSMYELWREENFPCSDLESASFLVSQLLHDREAPHTSLGPETGYVTEISGGFPRSLHGNDRIKPQIMPWPALQSLYWQRTYI